MRDGHVAVPNGASLITTAAPKPYPSCLAATAAAAVVSYSRLSGLDIAWPAYPLYIFSRCLRPDPRRGTYTRSINVHVLSYKFFIPPRNIRFHVSIVIKVTYGSLLFFNTIF